MTMECTCALALFDGPCPKHAPGVPLPPVVVSYPDVTVDPEACGGSPLVAGTRVPVRRVWQWHRRGVKIDVLVKRYPSLGWQKVLGALAFAYANEALIEADLDRERAIISDDVERAKRGVAVRQRTEAAQGDQKEKADV